MLGIIFGITNALINATSQVFLRRNLNHLKPSVAFGLETVFGIILWLSFGMLSGINFAEILHIFPIVFISAILSEAYIFYVYSRGDISIIGPVFASYSIYTIIFSGIINNEVLTLSQLIFVFFNITGSIIISLPEKNSTKWNIKPVLWGISGALAVGLSDSVSKTTIDQTSASTFLTALAFAQIIVASGFLFLQKERFSNVFKPLQDIKKYKLLLISPFLMALSMIFFWLSFENNLASIASPITSINTAFVVILAHFYLKEKITKKNLLGIILTLVGIIGISILSIQS